VLAHIADHRLLGGQLARAIERCGIGRRILVNRRAAHRTIDGAGGAEDEPPDPLSPHGFEQMRRSQHIDAPDVERSVGHHHRSGDGAAVDDRVKSIAVEQLIDLMSIGDVASSKVGRIRCVAGEVAGRHGLAVLRQSSDQRGADEASCAGDQNAPEVTLRS
jgi:hypothetical protein